jgi:hypothetical protein
MKKKIGMKRRKKNRETGLLMLHHVFYNVSLCVLVQELIPKKSFIFDRSKNTINKHVTSGKP